jgi:hypothetical protein
VGNAVQFFAKTTAGIGAGNFITVNVTNIDGNPVNATLQTAGDNLLDQGAQRYTRDGRGLSNHLIRAQQQILWDLDAHRTRYP